MTEKEIKALFLSGAREKAFEHIVAQYSEKLYWHLRRFVCSHEDADDLLQDTFMKIWAALPSFRWESQLFTWVYRVATNEALNFLRKKKLKAALSLESLNASMNKLIDEDPYFNGNELQRELLKAVQKLPEKQRLVFTMRYFDAMNYEQISEILNTSPGSLKASYHHAYVKIKAELEKRF